MPNKRKICTENINSNQSIYIASLNSYYQPESVLNSAYRKVLDFKENAEKILEKEKSETLNLNDFSKAILDSRSFEISLQHNCIKLKCYITLEKDKDSKKKRNEQQQQMQQQQQQTSPPGTPLSCATNGGGGGGVHMRHESTSSFCTNDSSSLSSCYLDSGKPNGPTSAAATAGVAGAGGGAKKVNVEVIMKSNPFRVEENEKTTRMELIKNTDNSSSGGGNMLRFTYYVRPECEKFRDTNSELFEKGRLVVFTNDFFTVYQDTSTGEMNISLNEIVQSAEEQKRTESLGEKLFLLLKDRPRHRALLTNECKLNHSMSMQNMNSLYFSEQIAQQASNGSMSSLVQLMSSGGAGGIGLSSSQEDETYYTRELIQIYGQPIVPSFHKHFNYQLSNTHYGYRTLRRLLNCDILKKYVKITKEEIKSLDRVVEFVQLTPEKCLRAFQLNITSFYDPVRFENGIVKNWLDVWYVDRLKEKYSNNNDFQQQQQQQQTNCSNSPTSQNSSPHSSVSSLTSSLSSPTNLSLSFATPMSMSGSSSTSWSLAYNDPILKLSNSHFQPPQPLGSLSKANCFLHTSNCCSDTPTVAATNGVAGQQQQQQPLELNSCQVLSMSECDQANHLWFCLKDYSCSKMPEFIAKLKDYIQIRNNCSELILVHTAHPLFEYKDVLSETRRILALFLNKSTINKTMDEIISKQFPFVAREHIEHLLTKFLIIDGEKKVVGFSALFEILMILKRELSKEKNDEMKYSHFLCTLERANQEKLKMAIVQLKCVPCLNKFTTNFNLVQQTSSSCSSSLASSSSSAISSQQQQLGSPTQINSNSSNKSSMVSHANMSRLLKQMSLIVSTELQQIAIDLYEKIDEDKPIKFIRLKDEFKYTPSQFQQQQQQQQQQQHLANSQMTSSQSTPQFKMTNQSMVVNSSCSLMSAQANKQYASKVTNENNNNNTGGILVAATACSQLVKQQQQQINSIQMNNLTASFKKVDLASSKAAAMAATTITPNGQQQQQHQQLVSNSKPPAAATIASATAKLAHIFNPKKDLEQFISQDQKSQQDLASFRTSLDRCNASSFFYSDTY